MRFRSTNADAAGYLAAMSGTSVGHAVATVETARRLESLPETESALRSGALSSAQAEAIAQTIPGLKHVVLWRGLLDLSRDIPNSNVDNQAVFDSGGAGLVSRLAAPRERVVAGADVPHLWFR